MGLHCFNDVPLPIANVDGVARFPLVVDLDGWVRLPLGSRRSLVRDDVVIALHESRGANHKAQGETQRSGASGISELYLGMVGCRNGGWLPPLAEYLRVVCELAGAATTGT